MDMAALDRRFDEPVSDRWIDLCICLRGCADVMRLLDRREAQVV